MTEVWFDPKHGGALRILDPKGKTITGTDRDKIWVTHFEPVSAQDIRVDFSRKRRTALHHGRTVMVARYEQQRNRLVWPDGNVWLRIRSNVYKLRTRLPKQACA